MSRPRLVISVTVVLALVIGVASYTYHEKTLTSQFADIGVASTTVSEVVSGGSLQDLTLAFPVGGRIKSVSVKVGDTVTAGTILASLDSENAVGAVNQAKGAYTAAQTAYQKLVNGASTPDIDVAKVALANAQNTYNTTVAQQKVLVANAFSAMMNSGITAVSSPTNTTSSAPVISGTYTGTEQGVYTIKTYSTGSGIYFSVDGLENGGNMPASATPSPLGSRGLYIQFPNSVMTGNEWTVTIPNTEAPTYLATQNAYQSALQNQAQAVSTTQGAVDAAQAGLNQELAGARSEDLDIAQAQVESTQGALQMAEGAYNNTIITAPVNGKIANVSITAGQIATPNTPAIELIAQ